jgi:HAMP domain-containing protein
VAQVNGQQLELSAREIGLLEVLLSRMGRLVSKDQLVDHLCGWGEEVSHNAIEVYVHRLRKKSSRAASRSLPFAAWVTALSDPKASKPLPPTSETERSLFGEILDWMLAPLLFVWPLSIAFTHYFANNVANFPYDQALREHVAAISRQVKLVNGKPVLAARLDSGAAARRRNRQRLFSCADRDGKLLAGDKDLPTANQVPDDRSIARRDLFARCRFQGPGSAPGLHLPGRTGRCRKSQWVLIEVGETTEKRSQLANKIVASVILPQFIIIPLAVMLVWFGLSRGLRPLTRLRQTIETREPADLSPIATRRVPEELEPLVEAFNEMLERMKRNVEAQQRFVADAAHQMRTPLTGLKTQAQLRLPRNRSGRPAPRIAPDRHRRRPGRASGQSAADAGPHRRRRSRPSEA